MVNVGARVISVIFHPLLMATYLFAILAFTVPSALAPLNAGGYLAFIVLIFLMSFILPLLNIGIFKTLGLIRTFTMEERKERIVPFSFIALLYAVVTYLLSIRGLEMGHNAMRLMLVADALVIVAAVITFFYKVSIHSIGICGLVGIIIPFNKVTEDGQLLIPTIALIVLAGVVMSARLQLQAHKPREILVGAIVGLLTGFMGITFLF